jgi:hypothetical protein
MRLIWIVCALLIGFVATVTLALVVAHQQLPTPQISVRFLGHSAGTDGVRVSRFEVSNTSPFAVFIRQGALVEFDSPGNSAEPMAGPDSVILPRQRQENDVERPPSTNQARWKLTLCCTARMGDFRSKINGLVSCLRDCGLPLPRPAVAKNAYFSSDWIDP